MVDLTSMFNKQTTLNLADEAFAEQQKRREPPRPYLGASSIGDECSRLIWYRFRWIREEFDALTLKRFRDGHITEQTVIEQLKLVTKVSATQDGFTDVDGHFSGHIDGEIDGLIEAPKTTHVLEIKATSEKKFKKLQDIILNYGQKLALRKWNPVYYAQIVLYMFYRKRTRAFHVIATAGGRDWLSIRTEEDNNFAKALIEKARRIIYSNDAPERFTSDQFNIKCKYCSLREVCYEKKLPERHCRTCLHSSPIANGEWSCAFHKKTISYSEQLTGCDSHAFIPSFVNGEIQSVEGNTINYLMKNGEVFKDGK